MANCPLCSDILLRHIRSGKTYWLCRRCRLEISEKKYLTPEPIGALLARPSVEWIPTSQYGVSLDRFDEPLPTSSVESR